MKLLDAKVDIACSDQIYYENDPTLHIVVDDFPNVREISHKEYRESRGRFLIGQEGAYIHFVYESDTNQSGALGGKYFLENGEETLVKGGWSSRASAVNEWCWDVIGTWVMDVTLHKKDVNSLGYAASVDFLFGVGAIERHCPEFELIMLEEPIGSSTYLSGEQAQAVGISDSDTPTTKYFVPALSGVGMKSRQTKKEYLEFSRGDHQGLYRRGKYVPQRDIK